MTSSQLQLLPQLGQLRSLALVGLGKNVGKTTALNALVDEWRAHRTDQVLGLTSIGRDGELLDAISSHAKPPVRVPAGTLVATSLGALPEGSEGFSVLETTSERTALGPVVIAQAKREIQWELSGPATGRGLREIRDKLWARGASLVVFDGAFDRRSSATPSLSEATLLVSGAALDADMANVLSYSAHMVRLFQTPPAQNLDAPAQQVLEQGGLAILSGSQPGKETAQSLIPLEGCSLLSDPEKVAAQCSPGQRLLVGRSLPSKFLNCWSGGELEVVTKDPTHMLIDPESLHRFTTRGGRLSVLRAIRLPLMVANPFSPYGWRFGAEEFLERLADTVAPLPVVDLFLRKTLHR